MKWVALCGVLGAAAWAQAPAKAPRDAGVAGPVDGGVPSAAAAKAKTEADALSARIELERMKAELAALKERTAMLEKQAAQTEAVTSQLEKMNKQLGDVKTQLAESEERRQETARRAAERKVQIDQSTASLTAAMGMLESGSPNIGAALSQAESVYTGAALQSLQLARGALANKDLFLARYYLSMAIAQAEAGRF